MHTDSAIDTSLHPQPDPSTAASTPALRTQLIEIDTFCAHCHYNLHGQVVTIDERLDIPICRCPECGRFHPAGTGITASTLWVRRFATILLFTWAGLVLAGSVATTAAFFPFQISSIEAFGHGVEIPATSAHKYGWVYYLYDWRRPGTPEYNGIATMLSISAGSLAAGFIAGAVCVTLLWHWPRARYYWTVILPLIPMAILIQIYRSMPEYEFIQTQCIRHILSEAAIQCIGVLLGVWLGRKVSRTLIRMIIPPKPRQAMAFLWSVDGKKIP